MTVCLKKHAQLNLICLLFILLVGCFLTGTNTAAATPVPEDLSETMECQFTPELTTLAASLGNDPVKIYNWVYENIEFEDYSKSRKGAQTTYYTKRGNEWDQCSLLITLLRISGIPSQYVTSYSQDKPWVEAWLPQTNYRGAGAGTDKAWFPLAPWKKEYQTESGINLFPDQVIPPELDFDFDNYVRREKQKTALELFEEQIQTYLGIHYPGKTLKDVPFHKIVRKELCSILPDNLPYRSIALGDEFNYYSDIPNNIRENNILYFNKTDGTPLLEKTVYWPKVAGKRLCLDFIPASDADRNTMAEYGGMCHTPDGAASIKPVLRINGQIIAEGSSLNTGEQFIIAYDAGDGIGFKKRPPKKAGSLVLISFDTTSVSVSEIERLKKDLSDSLSALAFSDDTRDEYMGSIGDILLKTYQLRKYDTLIRTADLCALEEYYWAGEGPTFVYTYPDTLSISNDIKYTILQKWQIDARNPSMGFRNAETGLPVDYFDILRVFCRNIVMYTASYNEGLIFEDWLGTAGLNTVMGLMVANETGIPIVTLTSSDIENNHLYILENQTTNRLPDSVISFVIDELTAGQTVTMPSQIIEYGGMRSHVIKSIGQNENGHDGYFFGFDYGGGSGDLQVYTDILEMQNLSLSEQLQFEPFVFENTNGNPVVEDVTTSEFMSSLNSAKSWIADPVNMVNGEYYHEELPDIKIHSRGFDLAVTRKYKSRLIYNGPFGYGWTWNHGEQLVQMDNGDVIFYNNEAEAFHLGLNPDGTYNYPPGSTFTLVKNSNGTYELTEKSILELFFDASGRLVRKQDSNGNGLVFDYDSQNRLSGFKDDLNRTLTFSYNGSGKITGLKDFTGRQCTYVYSGNDLVSVTDLEGNTTRYEYLSEQENSRNDHNMSKCILPSGDFLEIGYYKNDQVAFHRNKKGDVFNFQYSDLNRYGETWNEAGYYRKVFFNERNDEIRIDNEDGTIEQKEWDTYHNLISHTDGNGNITTFTWDEHRNQTSKTNALGETWSYTYHSVFNKPLKITDPKGNVTRMTYDNRGNLVTKTDDLGKITSFTYDDFGNLLSTTDPIQYTELNTYDENALYLISQKDKNGHITTIMNDNIGRPVSKTDASGYTTTIEYNEYGQKTKIIDAEANATVFHYNTNRKLTQTIFQNGAVKENKYGIARDIVSGPDIIETVDPLGNSILFEYDSLGNLLIKTDKNGNTYRYFYDGQNRLIEKMDPFQNTIRYAYDGNGNMTRKIDKRGNKTTYAYDVANRKISMTDPLNNTTTFEYDETGNLLKETLPNSAVTYYEYNTVNQLIRKTLAFGTEQAVVTEFTYDDAGRMTKTLYADGRYEAFDYDGNGNKVNHSIFNNSEVKLKEIRYVYDSRDLMIEKILDGGFNGSNQGTVYVYDALGRMTAEVDPAGNISEYEYDSVGNLIATTDPRGNKTCYSYDLANRLIKTVDAENRITGNRYDPNGNLVSSIDKQGNETRTYYNALNLKIGIEDPLNNIITFDYDADGSLIYVSDPNNGSTAYEYDAAGRRIKIIRPMGQKDALEYDSIGNITAKIDADLNRIIYQYDLLGRMTKQEIFPVENGYPADPDRTIYFSYDVAGNLTTYSDGTISAQYNWDSLNRKSSETVNYGPFSKSNAYEYPNSWEKRFTGPDNVTITRSYDNGLRLSRMNIFGQENIDFTDYEGPFPGCITYPGDSRIKYMYDSHNRIDSIAAENPTASVFMSRNYAYSGEGNILEKTTEHGTYSYGYDDGYRLISAENPDRPSERYTYDSVGNRLTASDTLGTWEYNQNNELVGVDDVGYEYDDSGTMIQKTVNGLPELEFTYDALQQLAEVKDHTGAVIASYYYDPFGRRLWKETNGSRIYYHYSDEGLIGEYDQTGAEIRSYGYLNDPLRGTIPLFIKEGNTYFWFINDQLGTPQQIIDSAGNLVWSGKYSSFGFADIEIADIDNNLRMQGQYFDEETGLHYNWHRYYDPGVGRYLRTDPMGLEAGMNLYVYVLNNPLKYTDPEGLMARATYDVGSTITNGFLQGAAEIPGAFHDAYTVGAPAAWEALEGARQLPDAIAKSFTPDTILTQVLATSAYTVGKTATEIFYGAYYDPVDFAISISTTMKKGLSENWEFTETRTAVEALDIGIQGQGKATMAADLTAAVFTQIDIMTSQAQFLNKFEATMVNALGIFGGVAGYFPPGAKAGAAIDTFTNSRVNYLLHHDN